MFRANDPTWGRAGGGLGGGLPGEGGTPGGRKPTIVVVFSAGQEERQRVKVVPKIYNNARQHLETLGVGYVKGWGM